MAEDLERVELPVLRMAPLAGDKNGGLHPREEEDV